MGAFRLVASGVNVSGVVQELEAHPDLWNARAYRTESVASPHHGIPDIWLRYRKLSELTSPQAYREEHFAEFYDEWNLVPSLHPIVYGLMAAVKAVYLGGIIVTRIPPGHQVKPHDDRGSWHAERMNTKAYLILKDNPWCLNHCDGDTVHMRTGDVWEFDNLRPHSVVNDGPSDRWTAIISMRCE